jgi:uncharacterized protein (DUF1800 family)
LRFAVAAVLAVAAVRPGSAAPPPPPDPFTVYGLDVPLLPFRLEGSFPLVVTRPGGPLAGTLTLALDVHGRLTGTWAVPSATLDARGTAKFVDGLGTLKLVLRRTGERITLKGNPGGPGFTGTTAGKGDLAPGEGTFTLDVAGAPSGTARMDAVLPPENGKTLKGTAKAILGQGIVTMKAVRAAGKTLRLDMAGGGVSWKGSGPPGSSPGEGTVSWTAKGWGGKVSGTGLGLETIPPPATLSYADPAPLFETEEPAAPDVPLASGGPVLGWSVAPALPAGLLLDPATGVVSGTPTAIAPAASYTVTASNLAGSTTAVLDLGVRINRAYSFAPEANTLTVADLRHFLSRTHFGIKPSELSAVAATGLPAYLDDMLDFKSGTAIETAAFQELVNPTDPPNLQGGFPYGYQLSRWWERIMLDTDRPFQEVMAFFWHDHMPTSYDVLDVSYSYFFYEYANILRHEGAGNLRTLLLDVARSQSMLVYLDSVSNNKFAPNENFAREFWELFTLGVDDGYTQADIVQAARAFTGYQYQYDPVSGRYSVVFNPALHDRNAKTIFGVVIPGQNAGDDYASVVDITLANRPVAEFVTRKIFEFFCYEAPPQSLVDAMAADLRGANYELKPFLKDLFRSEAFFSKKSRAGRVKDPVEYSVGLMRATGLKLRLDYTDYFSTLLGQHPGEPPTVNGWPLGTLWYSPASMVNRTNLAWYTVIADAGRQNAAGMNVANILPPPGQRTPQAVVDAVSGVMGVDLAASEEQVLVDYLNTVRQANGTVVPSPFDGNSQAQLDERVRGLVYILAQHPNFQVK